MLLNLTSAARESKLFGNVSRTSGARRLHNNFAMASLKWRLSLEARLHDEFAMASHMWRL